MLSPTQLAFLVGLPLCDCLGGELFAVILHPFGFASHSACTDDNAAVPELATALGFPEVTTCAGVLSMDYCPSVPADLLHYCCASCAGIRETRYNPHRDDILKPPPPPSPPPPPPSRYRLDVTQVNGPSYFCIEELSFYDSDGMKFSTSPDGGSSQYEHEPRHGNYAAGMAFDEDTNSYYCSDYAEKVSWLQYDFGSPTAVSKYSIKGLRFNANGVGAGSWVLRGSSDGRRRLVGHQGDGWTTLDSQSGHTWSSPSSSTLFKADWGILPQSALLGIHSVWMLRLSQ